MNESDNYSAEGGNLIKSNHIEGLIDLSTLNYNVQTSM